MAPADGFAEHARKLALDISNGQTIALSEIKGIIESAQRSDLHSAFEAESQAVVRTSRTKDNVAAVKVFGRKDVKPEFTGE